MDYVAAQIALSAIGSLLGIWIIHLVRRCLKNLEEMNQYFWWGNGADVASLWRFRPGKVVIHVPRHEKDMADREAEGFPLKDWPHITSGVGAFVATQAQMALASVNRLSERDITIDWPCLNTTKQTSTTGERFHRVVVGGPKRTPEFDYVAKMLERYGVYWDEPQNASDSVWGLQVKDDGDEKQKWMEYKTETERHNTRYEYGLVAKIELNEEGAFGRDVLIIAGCTSHGTLGAFTALKDDSICERLNEAEVILPDMNRGFVALIASRFEGNELGAYSIAAHYDEKGWTFTGLT